MKASKGAAELGRAGIALLGSALAPAACGDAPRSAPPVPDASWVAPSDGSAESRDSDDDSSAQGEDVGDAEDGDPTGDDDRPGDDAPSDDEASEPDDVTMDDANSSDDAVSEDADDATKDDVGAQDDDGPSADDGADNLPSGVGDDSATPTADDDADTGPGDGSEAERLRRRYVVAEGGAQEFVGYVDSETAALCEFAEIELHPDRKTCEPLGRPSLVYLDSLCTERALAWSRSFCFSTGQALRIGRQLFTLGQPLQPSAVFVRDAGVCGEVPVEAGLRYSAAEAAPEKPFAEGRVEVETLRDGLELVYAATDSDRYLLETRLLGAPCRVSRALATDDDAYCLPETTAETDGLYYLNASCSGDQVAVLGEGALEDGVPRYVRNYRDSVGCDASGRVRELLAEVATESVFRLEDEGCVEVPRGGRAVLGVSELLPLGDFPRFELQELGTGRLRYSVRVASNGVQVQGAGWTDVLLDTPCEAAFTSDGSLRCVPRSDLGDPGRYFEDASCSVPLLQGVLPRGASSCVAEGEADYFSELVAADSACAAPTRVVYEVELHAGTAYELTTSGGCQPAAPPNGAQLYARGAALPDDTFAELTSVER